MPYKDKQKLREFNREWLKKRRIDWINTQGGCCVNCGGIYKLQVDHRDPKMKVNHRVWSWRAERRNEELSKCQILCFDCHRLKTMQDMRWGLHHGTATAYSKYGCRCRACTDAAVQKVNEYRWRSGKRKKRIALSSSDRM